MRIERRYTAAGQGPYAGLDFRFTRSEIRNPMVPVSSSSSRMSRCPAAGRRSRPTCWRRSISARRACRAPEKKVEEKRRSLVPVALHGRRGRPRLAPEAERYVGETSSKQVFDRLAGTWTYWGWKGGYFRQR